MVTLPSILSISRYFPTVALFAGGLLATFLSQALLSRSMTLADFGAFTILYSAGTIISGLGSLGFDLSVMRFVPSALAHGDQKTAKIFGAYSLRKVLWSATAIGLAAVFCAYSLYQYSSNISILLGVTLFFWILVRYLSGVLRAYGHTNNCLFIDRVLRDGGIALIGAYALLYELEINLQFVTVILGILSISGCAIGGLVLGNFKRSYLIASQPIPKIWLTTSIGLLAVNVSELFGARIDIFLAGTLIDAKTAGAVGLLLTLTSLVTIPSAFLNVITMPMIAHHKQLGNYRELRKLLVTVTILAILGGAAIAAFLLLEGGLIFGIFSQEAVALIPPSTFKLVLIMRVFSMISHAMAPLLMMTGGERKLIGTHAISIIVKLVLCSFFLASFDIYALGILITWSTISLTALQIYFGTSELKKMQKIDNLR